MKIRSPRGSPRWQKDRTGDGTSVFEHFAGRMLEEVAMIRGTAMELSYYPGCALTGSARELDESFRRVSATLDIALKELPDWTCCGASSAHMVDVSGYGTSGL